MKSICDQTAISLKDQDPNKTDISYIQILARLFDLVHPTHQLQAAILAYPHYSAQMLKRRILSLGYDMGVSNNDETTLLDHKVTTELIRQLQRKLEKETKTYFEFIVPFKSQWRIGNFNEYVFIF